MHKTLLISILSSFFLYGCNVGKDDNTFAYGTNNGSSQDTGSSSDTGTTMTPRYRRDDIDTAIQLFQNLLEKILERNLLVKRTLMRSEMLSLEPMKMVTALLRSISLIAVERTTKSKNSISSL